MKLFRFDEAVGVQINQFDSNFINSRVVHTAQEAYVGCMYVKAHGIIGHHQTLTDQLFLVVQGKGWVSGEDGVRLPISTGNAAFWCMGEWHEAGTDTGMVAIVIESELLDPVRFMPISQ